MRKSTPKEDHTRHGSSPGENTIVQQSNHIFRDIKLYLIYLTRVVRHNTGSAGSLQRNYLSYGLALHGIVRSQAISRAWTIQRGFVNWSIPWRKQSAGFEQGRVLECKLLDVLLCIYAYSASRFIVILRAYLYSASSGIKGTETVDGKSTRIGSTHCK